jgi:hypothetical protein
MGLGAGELMGEGVELDGATAGEHGECGRDDKYREGELSPRHHLEVARFYG